MPGPFIVIATSQLSDGRSSARTAARTGAGPLTQLHERQPTAVSKYMT
jgi:hypothetical protein